jgi:hypothetical protein
MTNSLGEFTNLGPTSFTLNIGETQDVDVTFHSAAPGTFTDMITVASDASNGDAFVHLTGTTVLTPVVGAIPDSMAFSLTSNTVDSMTLTITNSGGGPLYFTLEDEDVNRKFTKQREVDLSYIDPSHQVEIAKDAVDWRKGTPQTEGSGGPDLYGYTWIDSDEPGGPTFNWIDISATGTVVTGLSDDNYVGPFPIGFAFNFYGTDYTEFYVQSNGTINFDDTYITLTNYQIPLQDSYNNMIAWLWDDLDPVDLSTVYYQNVGNTLVIQFEHYYEYPDGGAWVDAEMILSPNGKIVIQYDYFEPGFDQQGCTIGIENADGSDGLQVVYNAAYLHDQLALVFSLDSDWLSTNPTSGTVPPAGQTDVEVIANTDQMFGGDYLANVIINSNDPVDPEYRVPVSLHVIGVPDIGLSTTLMDWGTLFTNVNDTVYLGITNTGTDTLHVSSITNSTTEFTIAGNTAFSLLIGETYDLPVVFNSATAGTFNDSLIIVSNAVNPAPTVDLTAVAIDPPVVGVAPLAVTDSLLSGLQSTQYFNVWNDGSSPLYFDIEIEETIAANISFNHGSKRVVSELPLNSGIVSGNFERGQSAPSLGPAPITPVVKGRLYEPKVLLDDLYAWSIEASNGFVTYFDLAVPEVLNFTVAHTLVGFPGAGTFSKGDASFFYVLSSSPDNEFMMIDTSTGAFTLIGNPLPNGAESWTGMAFDPGNGTLYACAGDLAGGSASLYTIDPVTGVSTMVGSMGAAGNGVIAITVDGNGDMWGYEIITEMFLSIDKTTGAASAVGSIGFDANFGQGMCWDPVSDQIFLSAFNNTSFQAELRIADRATGNTSLVGVLGSTVPGGTTQLGFLAIPGSGAGWIAANPSADTLAVGDTVQVAVNFDATGLIGGLYEADIHVNSNDPVTPTVTVDASLHVTGVANIAVEPDTLDFGYLYTGVSDTMTFAVENPGTADLTVSGMTTSTADFTVITGTPFTVTPGGSYDVDVVYSAATSGVHSDSVEITHDAPVGEDVVQLVGETANPPVIALGDTLMHHQMSMGGEDSTTMMIYNQGVSDLEFSILEGHDPYVEGSLSLADLWAMNKYSRVYSQPQYLTKKEAQQAIAVQLSNRTGGPVTASNSDMNNSVGGSSVTLTGPEALGDVVGYIDVETPIGNNQEVGVGFDGTFLWVTGRHDVNGHQLYVFDLLGNLLAQYPQGTTSTWGMRDLAFDGQYLYAGDDNGFYQIDPVTGVVTNLGAFPNTHTALGVGSVIRGLAYDAVNDVFWTSDYNSDIVMFDRNDSVRVTFPYPISNIYGMAFDVWSDGGPYLWAFAQAGVPTDLEVAQIDPNTGALTGVGFSGDNTNTGIAGGCDFIPDAFIPGQVILAAMHQETPDAVYFYDMELLTGLSWVDTWPTEGTLSGGDSLEVMVYWHGVETEDLHEGYLGFRSNDPVNRMMNVHLMLDLLTGIEDKAEVVPTQYALHQNYPNPFNPSTTIKYDLKAKTDVKLTIYNILGQKVRTLVNMNQSAGFKHVVWDGLNEFGEQVSTGVYIYRIEAGDPSAGSGQRFVKSRKMVFMK